MNKGEFEALKNLNISLSQKQNLLFEKYIKAFKEENSKINLISKNDEAYLFEKHIYDSLSLNLFSDNIKSAQTLLDIGTGGGFPSVPLAILFPEIKIFALDSIAKKTNAVKNIKDILNLENLTVINDRAENLSEKFDIVTSRAVASLEKIIPISAVHVKKGGYFIAYKSIKSEDELAEAQKVIRNSGMKFVKTVDYKLPLQEVYNRKLMIFKKI